MSILFVSEIEPYPPNGGEKLRSYGMLRLLSSLDFTIHAIIGKGGNPQHLESSFGNLKYHPFNFTEIYSASRLKNYLHAFTINKKLAGIIHSIIKNEKIDLAIIDYNFYGQYIGLIKKYGIPVIYGTHNAQAHLVRQKPARVLKEKFWRFADYLFYRIHEYVFFRRADALIVVSDEDKEYHKSLINRDRIHVIPNFLAETDYNSDGDSVKENYVVMTANFYVFQNYHGLEWFVSEVWDKELSELTKLILVGHNSDKCLEKIAAKYFVAGISATGSLNDIKPYISKAKAAILPLLHGSGTRLKCLEAMALKTQVISTTKGAEGIQHEDSILIADNPVEFKNAMLRVIKEGTDYTALAYDVFLNSYSLKSNRKVFQNIVNEIRRKDKT